MKCLIESSGLPAEVLPNANIRLLYVISTVGILLLQAVYTGATRKNRAEG